MEHVILKGCFAQIAKEVHSMATLLGARVKSDATQHSAINSTRRKVKLLDLIDTVSDLPVFIVILMFQCI